MALNVKTNLGNIVVNDTVIAKMLIRAVEKTDDKIMLSSHKAKILGIASKISSGDVLGNFIAEEKDDAYYLDFYAVIKFGASIKSVSQMVLDSVEEEMKEMFPDKECHITLHIVGVKSKQIALRDIEVKRDYESAR